MPKLKEIPQFPQKYAIMKAKAYSGLKKTEGNDK